MLDTKKAKTLEALIGWLETKPPEQPYRYGDARGCLAAQYNDHIGADYKVPNIGIAYIDDILDADPYDTKWPFDKKLEWIAFKGGPATRVRTFGVALKVAKELV